MGPSTGSLNRFAIFGAIGPVTLSTITASCAPRGLLTSNSSKSVTDTGELGDIELNFLELGIYIYIILNIFKNYIKYI